MRRVSHKARAVIIHERKAYAMPIKLNDNKDIVRVVREGLRRTGGYCPCKREQTEDTKCICREFREQMADPGFEGFCHCMLYYKYNE